MTDKKFTDEEIIKALEICTNGKLGNEDCINCPYESGIRLCSDYLMLDALDLINHLTTTNKNYEATIKRADELIDTLKAEIEKLNVELVGMRGACESYKMHYDKAQAEIERLQEELKITRACVHNNGLEWGLISIKKLVDDTKTKAIKEMTEVDK